MTNMISFNYCALIILIILLVSNIFRGMTRGRQNHCFALVLLVVSVSVIADIAAIHLEMAGTGNIAIKYFINTVYFLSRHLTTPFYLIYLISQTDTWHKLRRNRSMAVILSLPFLLAIVLLAVNPFCRIIFYFDEYGRYVRGSYLMVLYAVALCYVIYGIYYICKYRKLFSKGRFVSLISMYPLIFVAVMIQLFYPDLVVESFTIALALLFVSSMVQRPEEIIDIDTGLKRLSAYVVDMRHSFINQKPTEIIMINVTNYSLLCGMLGYDRMNELLRNIAGQVAQVNKKQNLEAELYYLGVGKFRMVIEEPHFKQTEEIGQMVNRLLKMDYEFHEMKFSLLACVCIAKCPDDIADVDSLIAFGNSLNAEMYNGEVLYASVLYKKEYYDLMRDMDYIIERALSEHKFAVYYQPIYSVKEQRFNSAEALIRLKDEEYGFISPELFIPAAEKSGAIHKIGSFVLDEVCRFIASPEFKDLGIDYIEVNLSVAQCMQSQLADEVLATMKSYRILPEQINLEITETAASYSQNTMMENLNSLAAAGIGFSLDDFGTGYSNMGRIATLPLQIIKLDKSFVNAEANPKLYVILKNTIKMIKDMQMKIVVEGIETEHLVKRFSDWECDYIQGYYYSRPLPKGEFIAFVERSKAQNI